MKSIIREKAEKDPNFCPDCLKCGKKTRHNGFGKFEWFCMYCGYVYNEHLLKRLNYKTLGFNFYWKKENGQVKSFRFTENQVCHNMFWALSHKVRDEE